MTPFRFHPSFAAALLLTASLALSGTVRAAEPYEAFLEKHCIRCHGPEKEKGDLRLDRLSRDFKLGADSHHWAEAIEQVNSGEMPPKKDKEKKPTQEEIAEFVTSLDARLKEGRASRMAARPAVAHYRLSRKEYQNTVYDLLGVRYDPAKPSQLVEDALWHGYERIGSQLSLSSSHVERYYRAAGIVLDRAFPASPVEPQKVRKTAAEYYAQSGSDLAKQIQAALDQFGIKRPLRYLLVPVGNGFGPDFLALHSAWLASGAQKHPARSGLYRMRIQASGIRPRGGQLPHLMIGPRDPASTLISGIAEFDITAPEDAPQVYEAEMYLDMPTQLNFLVVATNIIPRFANQYGAGKTYIFTHSSEPWNLNQNSSQVFDDKGNSLFSVVIVDWIEWEGPLESEAEKAQRTGLLPPDDASPEVVAEHLERFATRAWRRPVTREELSDYLQSYRTEREAGEKTVDAFRVALRGVLTADEFLYLVEGAPEPRERLTDFELASRLSYFLWSSMPDDSLFTAAGGVGLKGAGLEKEVDRMCWPTARSDASSRIFPGSGCSCTAWACFRRTRRFIPSMTLGSRRACVASPSSSFARCSRRICRSRASSIPTGRSPTPGSASSTGCRSRR
jgi:mono/diheme cytochrome c family protein